MATKQERAIKSAVTREKKKGIVREEKHILWILLAIIAVLLYLLFAQHSGWWPFIQPKLGNAFYTNVIPNGPTTPASSSDQSGGTSSTNNGSSTGSNSGSSTGSNSGSGSNSGGSNNNGGGGSTTPSSGSDPIGSLAATINVGESKTDVNSKANGLGTNCAVVVNATSPNVGKQEVCTYSQGDKIITVTYLNDRVISASKSGF
jgi:hypothetical protein